MIRYLSILRRRTALLPFMAAVIGRLPIAMAPLGMVLLVQSVRGTYSVAGVITAAFALGAAVSAPGWGRLMDRYGQSLIIGPISVSSAILLALLALGTAGGRSTPVLVALAAGVGLTFPPISPAMRGAWRAALDTDLDRRAAYALDAVAVEAIFAGGPLLLSVLLRFPPAVPLLVTAALLGVGGGTYALTGAARAWRAEPPKDGQRDSGTSPLRTPRIRLVLMVADALSVGFGLTDVSIAATAREGLQDQARVGLLFAAIASGSASGGLWYGSRAWRRPEHVRLPVSLAGVTAGLTALGVLLTTTHPGLPALMPVLFCTGLCIAPGLIILANLIDHHGPPGRLSEAQAWLSTAYTAGSALGTAVAGVAVDTGGPGLGFLCAAVAVASGATGSFAAARAWRR